MLIRPLRPLDFSDLATHSSEAFWDDELFSLLYPHRETHPTDFRAYWMRLIKKKYYRQQTMFVAVTESGDPLWTGAPEVVGYSSWTWYEPGVKAGERRETECDEAAKAGTNAQHGPKNEKQQQRQRQSDRRRHQHPGKGDDEADCADAIDTSWWPWRDGRTCHSSTACSLPRSLSLILAPVTQSIHATNSFLSWSWPQALNTSWPSFLSWSSLEVGLVTIEEQLRWHLHLDRSASRPAVGRYEHILSTTDPFVAFNTKARLHCNMLVVSPRHQNQGIGGRLLQWGMDRACEHDVPVTLVASIKGRRLYLKKGFREVGKVTIFPDKDVVDLAMVWNPTESA